MNCSLSGSSVSGFPRREYWSGLPFPSPGDFPNPGIEPESDALADRFFTTEPPRKPRMITVFIVIKTIDAIKRNSLITKESTGDVDAFS